MSVEYERQKFIEIKESNDLVNWAKGYNGFKIVPKARDQGKSDTCQFYGVVAGGDMGNNKSMADHKKSSDIHFEEEDLIAEAKSVHKIEGNITKDNAPYSHDLLAIFEDNGVMATSSEWDGMKKRDIAGFSSGLPKTSQIMDLIKQAVPLLGHFDCCKYFGKLKPNQVYVPPKMLRGKRKLADLDKVITDLNPHLVLICGFGLFQLLLYLIFLNSWSETFCQDGYGRIPFNSITLFHTLKILSHPQLSIKVEGERSVRVNCYGLSRRVEKELVCASPFMKKELTTDDDGIELVTLQPEVTPVAFSLILTYLTFHMQPREEEEKVSFNEAFVKQLSIKAIYDVIRAVESLQFWNLARSSASVLEQRTYGWTDDELKKCLHHQMEVSDWKVMKRKISGLAEEFEDPTGWKMGPSGTLC